MRHLTSPRLGLVFCVTGNNEHKGLSKDLAPANLAPARRGLDDAPPADPEPETDVGAPVDRPGDVPVLLPSGTVHRPGAAEDELLMAASWVDWDLVAMSS